MQPIIVHIQTDPKTFAARTQQWLDKQSQGQKDRLTSRIDFMSGWFYRYEVKDHFIEADPPEVEIDAISVRTWRKVKELSSRPYRISKPEFPTDDGDPVSIARILFLRQGKTELHLPQWQDCGIERDAFIAAIIAQLGTAEIKAEQQASTPVTAEQEEPAAGGEKEGKPSTVGSGHPGRECNRKAIERLNAGEGRKRNFETWCAEYAEETGTHPDSTVSGAEELYRKSVWEKRKK